LGRIPPLFTYIEYWILEVALSNRVNSPMSNIRLESPSDTPMNSEGAITGSLIQDLSNTDKLSQDSLVYDGEDLLVTDISLYPNIEANEQYSSSSTTHTVNEVPMPKDPAFTRHELTKNSLEKDPSKREKKEFDAVCKILDPKSKPYKHKYIETAYTLPHVNSKIPFYRTRRLLHREVIIGALHTEEGYLIQVGAIEIVNKEIQPDVFSMYFDPGEVNLDAKIINNYGITRDFLKKHRTVENSLKFFLDFINDAHILTHSECFCLYTLNNLLISRAFTPIPAEKVKLLNDTFSTIQDNATLRQLSGLNPDYNTASMFSNSLTGLNLIDDIRLVSLIYINTKWDLYGISVCEENRLECGIKVARKSIVYHESPAQLKSIHMITDTPHNPP